MADEQVTDTSCDDAAVKATEVARKAKAKAKEIARREPLSLPKGTVRAITMWGILLFVFGMSFLQITLPGEFVALAIFIVKQYYDDRATMTTPPPTQ